MHDADHSTLLHRGGFQSSHLKVEGQTAEGGRSHDAPLFHFADNPASQDDEDDDDDYSYFYQRSDVCIDRS